MNLEEYDWSRGVISISCVIDLIMNHYLNGSWSLDPKLYSYTHEVVCERVREYFITPLDREPEIMITFP